MNGWRHIGRVTHVEYPHASFTVADDVAQPGRGDIVAVAPALDGPLRAWRGRVGGSFNMDLGTDVATGDFVFVATALGENAFRRPAAP